MQEEEGRKQLHNFKYTSEENLKRMLKKVQRKRQQSRDEERWKICNDIKKFEKKLITEQFLLQDKPCEFPISFQKYTNNEDENAVRQQWSSEITNSFENNICNNFASMNINQVNHCSIENFSPTLIQNENNLHSPAFMQNLSEKIKTSDKILEPMSIQLIQKLSGLVISINKVKNALINNSQLEPLDGDKLERNLKWNTEFTVLFARNYLYRIQLQKKEAKKWSPFSQEKLVVMYTTALQALQIYERHLLRTNFHKKCAQQLEQIFDFVIFLVHLTGNITGHRIFPYKEELIDGSNQLKKLLVELSKKGMNFISRPVKKKKTKKQQQTTKQKTPGKLSMYVSNRPIPFWKKASVQLARARFGAPSSLDNKNKKIINKTTLSQPKGKKNEEITYREENLDVEEENVQNDKPNLKNNLCTKTSFRNTTRAVPEEEVVSMMEILKPQFIDSWEEENVPSKTPINEDFVEFLQESNKIDSKNMKECAVNEAENISEQKSLESVKHKNPDCSDLWPKNVQMLCIKADENNKSLENSEKISLHAEEPLTKQKDPGKRKLHVSASDRNIALQYIASKSTGKDFLFYEEGNKPWEIVSRIADAVTLETLKSVCKSLEIDVVIEKLYDLEFQQ